MNEEAKNRALKLLEKRDLSRKMLLDRLREKGVSEADAREVTQRLCELGVVDDRRFAAMVARHYAARGYGQKRIEQELYRRGIPRELWDEAASELPGPEDALVTLLRRKLRGGDGSPEELRRAQGFLLRRGYSYEEIRSAMEQVRADKEVDVYE